MKKTHFLPSILIPVLFLANSFFFAEKAFAQCDPIGPITTTGSGEFIVPDGVTSITVEVWGAGGKGGSRTSNGRGGGGGGGAYSQSVFTVTPRQIFNYNVGAGSNTTAAGEDTWFGSATTLMAKGGASVPNNNINGGQGGQATAGYGDVRYSGGNGSNASNSGTVFSGGGGSSASSLGDGTNSTSNTGASAPLGGGDGGNGTVGNGNSNGQDGDAPGGGGGGARRNNQTRNGGNGGNGQIIISYTCPCFTVLDNGNLTGVTVIQFNENCTWEAPEGLLDFEVLVIGGGGGGGFGNGGGGGGGGIVHARVNVEDRIVTGLPVGTNFEVLIGNGGMGSTDEEEEGQDGGDSTFDLGGLYEIIAGGGGGGGSQDEGDGLNGRTSVFNSSTVGFSSLLLRGGSGGGGADDEDGGNGSNGAGNGGESEDNEAGGGGGGASSNGQDSDEDDEEGGNGGAGLQFSSFDISLNRFFSAGGGGGGQSDGGNGGNGGSGGAGGEGEEDDDPLSERIGRDASTPGSGGGGGAEDARGGNGARGIVFIGYANSRILPVEYIFLVAEFDAEERMAELTWTTSMERENSHFEIQRSTDGLKSWEVIGNVDGMGWSDAPVDYRFEDVNPIIAGGTVYYRLNQVDFNGKSTLSKVLSVKVPGVQFTEGVWRAYPNPTNGDQLRVNLLDKSQYHQEPITFRIIHPTSISGELSVNSENEMNEAISQMVGRIPKGVFVIEVKWGQKIEHIKVLKK
ncbi:T9SS type A sorting domain-containing protein [Aquiflexum gelatinilyticum]|uniref:T9SS type A sorting domain-containing protein n=1 Tax=Aquiflexum gelatinilyticum TaxID=2961943 RepID=A0A9X2P3H1_9BACT|nr:T9SS type A sorting domain-containing protein [Aquiflexum gelatinilyticum]MCR9015113.1 T9SS type A sorting domain-containing protein [Aquiflexum gelatinilyticum]